MVCPALVLCRVLVSHEAPVTSGFGAEVITTITDRCWGPAGRGVGRAGLRGCREAQQTAAGSPACPCEAHAPAARFSPLLPPHASRRPLPLPRCFWALEAPPVRVCGYDTPFPLVYEPLYLPTAARIVDAIQRTMRLS